MVASLQRANLLIRNSHTPLEQPSGGIWGSVSHPRTLRRVDWRSRGSNHQPSDWWTTPSTYWATAGAKISSQFLRVTKDVLQGSVLGSVSFTNGTNNTDQEHRAGWSISEPSSQFSSGERKRRGRASTGTNTAILGLLSVFVFWSCAVFVHTVCSGIQSCDLVSLLLLSLTMLYWKQISIDFCHH